MAEQHFTIQVIDSDKDQFIVMKRGIHPNLKKKELQPQLSSEATMGMTDLADYRLSWNENKPIWGSLREGIEKHRRRQQANNLTVAHHTALLTHMPETGCSITRSHFSEYSLPRTLKRNSPLACAPSPPEKN